MSKLARLLAACLVLAPALSFAEPSNEDPRDDQIIKTAWPDRSVAEVLLFYVPNRVFDLLDIARVRVRVGPGIAARARATKSVSVGLGSYTSLYVGLPGPRQKVKIPLPLGAESFTGIEVGPGDAQVATTASPEYTDSEIGASVHALVVGLDVGVDPFELVDLLTGFALIDIRADDF
jgi:hypothetical protein